MQIVLHPGGDDSLEPEEEVEELEEEEEELEGVGDGLEEEDDVFVLQSQGTKAPLKTQNFILVLIALSSRLIKPVSLKYNRFSSNSNTDVESIFF